MHQIHVKIYKFRNSMQITRLNEIISMHFHLKCSSWSMRIMITLMIFHNYPMFINQKPRTLFKMTFSYSLTSETAVWTSLMFPSEEFQDYFFLFIILFSRKCTDSWFAKQPSSILTVIYHCIHVPLNLYITTLDSARDQSVRKVREQSNNNTWRSNFLCFNSPHNIA